MADAPFTLDPSYTSRLFQIESGGNPNAVTGSNRGLAQFSPDLEQKYGITSQNRTDPNAQSSAVAQEAQEHAAILGRALGRPPTPGELYLSHQQGPTGAVAHLTNPDQPAWQTIRPYYKSDAIAKQAIWGNVPDRGGPFHKGMFPGGVDDVTSGAFGQGWVSKFERGLPGSPQMAASTSSGAGAVPTAPAAAAQPAGPPAGAAGSGGMAPDGASPTPPIGAGMLSGADLSNKGPDIGQLAQRAMGMMAQPQQQVAPMKPLAIAMPKGLSPQVLARLQMAALGRG